MNTKRSENHDLWRPIVLTATICLASLGAAPAAQDGSQVDSTRATLEKWVETRRVMSKEQRDWDLGREMLTSRIELVQSEIETLRGKIAEAEESIAGADEKLTELVAEREELAARSSALRTTVAALETRTKELLQRLPDPLRERVRPLSQGLPEDPEDARTPLADRYRNVVGLLNEVDKFNREITTSSEVRTLADGARAEVTALYVGIGQAYYTSRSGSSAGVGRASAQGWVWAAAEEAAREIALAISILGSDVAADFVPLPMRIE